jgi:hypothetical protein
MWTIGFLSGLRMRALGLATSSMKSMAGFSRLVDIIVVKANERNSETVGIAANGGSSFSVTCPKPSLSCVFAVDFGRF